MTTTAMSPFLTATDMCNGKLAKVSTENPLDPLHSLVNAHTGAKAEPPTEKFCFIFLGFFD